MTSSFDVFREKVQKPHRFLNKRRGFRLCITRREKRNELPERLHTAFPDICVKPIILVQNFQ
jgi:hypothetical protein